MKFLTILNAFLFFSIPAFGQSLSQEVIATSGDFYADSNVGDIHWTVGELMTERYENGDILTQGFHQTFVLFTKVYENPSEEISIRVFPNPFVDQVIIETTSEKSLSAQLLNIYGQVMAIKVISPESNLLNFSSFPSGTYLLNILDETGVLRTYKLQKINF